MKRVNVFLRISTFLFSLVFASLALLPGTGARYVAAFDEHEGARVVWSYVWTYNVTGAHQFTAPATGYYGFALRGGSGARAHGRANGGQGGRGGVVTGVIRLDEGDIIHIFVGSGGLGGSGRVPLGGGWTSGDRRWLQGGGFSVITTELVNVPASNIPDFPDSAIIALAGGGGGGGEGGGTVANPARVGGHGGDGNGPGVFNGTNGQDRTAGSGGGGGSNVAGAMGANSSGGSAAARLRGGDGPGSGQWGGAGGGGWFGGGRGGNEAGGGGGSSFNNTAVIASLPAAIINAGILSPHHLPQPIPANASVASEDAAQAGANGSGAIVFLGTRNPDGRTFHAVDVP